MAHQFHCPRCIRKSVKQVFKEKLTANVHSSPLCNSQEGKTMSIKCLSTQEWIHRMWSTHMMEYYSTMKEWGTDTWYSVEKPWNDLVTALEALTSCWEQQQQKTSCNPLKTSGRKLSPGSDIPTLPTKGKEDALWISLSIVPSSWAPWTRAWMLPFPERLQSRT